MDSPERNWPFFMFTTLPVAAAATKSSVWRQRNAGICNTSTYCAAISASSLSWMSVTMGTLKVSRTFARIFNAFSSPIPVNDLADDITGFNLAEFTLGEKGADRLKAINAFTGIFSSYNFNKTFPEFNMAIGNVGDAKDLYELDTKICYDKSK